MCQRTFCYVSKSKFTPTLKPSVGLWVRQIHSDSVKLSEIHHIVRTVLGLHEISLILIAVVDAAIFVQMRRNVAEQPNSFIAQIPYFFV